MRTEIFKLKLDNKTARAIQTIALTVPCFITLNSLSDFIDEAEYTITAHKEDWNWVHHVIEENI